MLEKVLLLCNLFENKEINIIEFQKRLQTFLILDEQKNLITKLMKNVDNKLEEIIYSNFEENYYKLAMEVVTYLKNEIKIYNKKLK